jgi:hypothetical protein
MHLPSSGSAQSVRAEVDPFGAGEPASFFRFDYRQNEGNVMDLDRSIMQFYENVGAEGGALRKQKSGRSARSVGQGTVPEIIVSSSAGLLRKSTTKSWAFTQS